MDGNKDDALKCLKIGKEAFESGDHARALKFVTKARRLDPTLPVDDLLLKIESEPVALAETNNNGSNPDPSTSVPSEKPTIRHRSPANGSATSSSTVAYTQEQIAIVREIKKKKCYYEILGLEKSCTVEDVRKAYRKLSLKVHPDKNKAPGAEDAFKAVSKAFQCLSNEESRRKYDITGSEEPVYERRAARHGHGQGFNGFYEAEFDADEIFRNFFFGGMHPATTQYRTFHFGTGARQRHADNGSGGGGSGFRLLIQLLPVILILLLNFLPSSEPIYSLQRTYPYEYKFITQKGVNYYVKSMTFEQDYPPNSQERVAIEVKIERDYVSILSQNCRYEMQRRQWGFIREMPHCDMLQKFQDVA